MILVSIISDAFFSDSQAFSKVTFHPTANHLFTAANKWAFLFVFVNAIVQNELIPSVNFLINHPTAIIDLLGVCCLQLVGQICIYLVVANFKQHIYPLISTVRKIFTILLSILVFGHPMTIHQWFAMVLVFGGMAYEFVDEVNSHEKKNKAKGVKEAEVPDEGTTP
jgi:UDP-galactose transporter B1